MLKQLTISKELAIILHIKRAPNTLLDLVRKVLLIKYIARINNPAIKAATS